MLSTIAHRIALAIPAALAAAAVAQPAIFSNASASPSTPALATATVTASGIAAPSGGIWSELQSDGIAANATGGLATHTIGAAGTYRLADSFTIPTGQQWRIDAISVYAYQPGAAANPFAAANLRIWNGRPGEPGSVIVVGDTTTSVLQSVTATGIYRAFNTTAAPAPVFPDSTKRIWDLRLSAGQTTLIGGTYWIDWQITPANLSLEAYTPTVTLNGLRTLAGFNARQFGPTGWTAALDTGKPANAADVAVDFPFILYGYMGNPPCTTDFDGDGDSGTDADIEAFFRCLAGNCCTLCASADYDGDGDSGTDADIEAFFRVLSGNPC